jgi:hypothetical protein
MENIEIIHIGNQIKKRVLEKDINIKELMMCFRCSNQKIVLMLNSSNMKTDLLMKWSLKLDYDFFNFYTHEFLLRKEFNKNQAIILKKNDL